MSQFREITSGNELTYGKVVDPNTSEALVPVVVVDQQRLALDGLTAIRMQGWANREAVDITFQTGNVTFWSRSKQGLWTKGEESGNFLLLRAAYTDCDSDSLLLDAEPIGPTCHTGAQSCFEVADGEF